jgi:hypothetical protein
MEDSTADRQDSRSERVDSRADIRTLILGLGEIAKSLLPLQIHGRELLVHLVEKDFHGSLHHPLVMLVMNEVLVNGRLIQRC